MNLRSESERPHQPLNQPLDAWHIDWLLSDAPRSPGEAIDRVRKIERETGKSAAEATLELVEELKALSERQEEV